ncbi:MAG: hypothetical protein DRO12_01565, partial [Thermoprotei archaeon]
MLVITCLLGLIPLLITHEIMHYLVARALGLNPLIRLKFNRKYLIAISVEIPSVREYETISQIK